MGGFFSKRNQVYPVLWHGRAGVKQHYLRLEDARIEREMYAALRGKLSVPQILSSEIDLLVTEYLPYPHLLDVLNQQEQLGFQPEPWERLTAWLLRCHAICGKLPDTGNLRNFLWDEHNRRIIGIDLEEYRQQSIEECGGSFTAFIRQYDPAGTPAKEKAAALIAQRLGVSPLTQDMASKRLLKQRPKHGRPAMTGIILAGVHSARNEQDKSLYRLMGKTLMEWQVDKLRELGVQTVLVVGSQGTVPRGVRAFVDAIPVQGPLEQICIGLKESKTAQCIVLREDMPLVPVQILYQMMSWHHSDITLLSHRGKVEQFIGIYDSAVGERIMSMHHRAGVPTGDDLKQCHTALFDYQGPEDFLFDCSCPGNCERLSKIVRDYNDAGISLG